MWDTHVHLFDPERFPYSLQRTYTPLPASIAQLQQGSPGTHFLLAQASVEDGDASFLSHLRQMREHPSIAECFGAIIYQDHFEWSDKYLSELDAAGIRVVRYHAALTNKQPAEIADQVRSLLEGRLGEIARTQRWAISMQLPLPVWALLEDINWSTKFRNAPVIAEHVASVSVPLSAETELHLSSILRQMQRSGLIVKICALHRRVAPGHEAQMEEVLRRLAEAGNEQLLWGSDWPHVSSHIKGLEPGPFVEADAHAELAWIRSWLPPSVLDSMLLHTPRRIFHRSKLPDTTARD